MSFKPFAVNRPQKPSSTTGVRASVRGNSQKRPDTPPFVLLLTFQLPVFAPLGWDETTDLMLLVGEGGDHGILRLTAATAAAPPIRVTRRQTRSPYFHLDLGVVPGLCALPRKSESCNWEVLDDAAGRAPVLEIVLPAWAEETGPRAKTNPALPALAPVETADPRAARVRAELETEEDKAEAARDARQQSRARDCLNLQEAFGLSPLEADLVALLAETSPTTKPRLHAALYAGDADGGPDVKIIDVMVSKVRRKLDASGVTIETRQGGHLMMPDPSRNRVRRAMAGEAA